MLWGWFGLAVVAILLMLLCVWAHACNKRRKYVILAFILFVFAGAMLIVTVTSVIDIQQKCEAVGAGVECNSAFSAKDCYCRGPMDMLIPPF